MEQDFGSVFFLKIEFFEGLLFRAVFDTSDCTYKCSIKLPPGRHSLVFYQAQLVRDPNRDKLKLNMFRVVSKNELILPNDGEIFSNAKQVRRNATMSLDKRFGGFKQSTQK